MSTDHSDLIRAFEPILYMPKGERFFPSDSKRYLERSGLWTSDPAKDPPGVGPKLGARGKISGKRGEPESFLPNNIANDENCFLEVTGWIDGRANPAPKKNRFANLDRIAEAYNLSDAVFGDMFLSNSRFWYHAEVFDEAKFPMLIEFANGPHTGVVKDTLRSLSASSGQNGKPLLLIYNFFFPGYDLGIAGCDLKPDSDMFGSFAGQWSCFALLLRSKDSLPGTTIDAWFPESVGFSIRSPNGLGNTQANILEDARIELKIHNEQADGKVDFVSRDRGMGKHPGSHARLFAVKGTHTFSTKANRPESTPNIKDPAANDCGQNELLEIVVREPEKSDSVTFAGKNTWAGSKYVVASKIAAGGLFGGLIGAAFGAIWAGIEYAYFTVLDLADALGLDEPLPAAPAPTETTEQLPKTTNPEDFQLVITPFGLPRASIPPSGLVSASLDAWSAVTWPAPLTKEASLETEIGGKTYSLMISRTLASDAPKQNWWPSIQGDQMSRLRWGPEVNSDPFKRRAGMAFQEYWTRFLVAYAKSKSA
jgi:hypothetical protein